MYKKLISSILVVALLNLVGCYSFESLTIPEYEQIEEKEDKPDEIKVIAKDFKEYHFVKSGFHIESDTLYGKGKVILNDNEQSFEGKIALSNIESIEVENFNFANTFWLGIGIISILGIISIAIIGASLGNLK